MLGEWFLTDAGWLFFAVWSALIALLSLAAFGRDIFPSEVFPPKMFPPKVRRDSKDPL